MKAKLAIALGMITLVAVALSSCSKTDTRSAAGSSGALVNPMAPLVAAHDSSHGGGPPPNRGPKPPAPAVVFISSDSAVAGQTVITRWKLHNDAHQAFSMSWVLTSVNGWPGFPKSGSVSLAPRGDQLLSVPVTVPAVLPDSSLVGTHFLLMTVTQKNGSTATASGAIQVTGN